jgi:hypothetical protein
MADQDPPVEPGPFGLYADLAAVVGVLTDARVAMDPQTAFCLLTIGYGIILAAELPPDDAIELTRRARAMARELTPVIMQALRGEEAL